MSNEYSVVTIPEPICKVGYREGCYVKESNLFTEHEFDELDNEDYGYFKPRLRSYDNIPFVSVIEDARKGIFHTFQIKRYTRIN